MNFNIDLIVILKAVIDNLPREQLGYISCCFAVIGAGTYMYKIKLEHEYKMATLNTA